MLPEDQKIVRDIIRDELKDILKIDRFVFPKHLQIMDARNIQLGKGTGTKFGTEIIQKLGFFDATPVIQRASAAQAILATTGVTQTNPYGFSTSAQGDAVITLVNEIRAALIALGFIKGSV